VWPFSYGHVFPFLLGSNSMFNFLNLDSIFMFNSLENYHTVFQRAALLFSILWGFQFLRLFSDTRYYLSFWLQSSVGVKCFLFGVLICVSPISNDAQHLSRSLYIFYIFIYFWENVYLDIFPHFKIGLFVFLFLRYKRVKNILDKIFIK
jgi:hypothetical protein